MRAMAEWLFISRRRPLAGQSPAPPSDPSRFAAASAGPS